MIQKEFSLIFCKKSGQETKFEIEFEEFVELQYLSEIVSDLEGTFFTVSKS